MAERDETKEQADSPQLSSLEADKGAKAPSLDEVPPLAALATRDVRGYALLYLRLLAEIALAEEGQPQRDFAAVQEDALGAAVELAYIARLLETSEEDEEGRALLPLARLAGDCLLLIASAADVPDVAHQPLASAEEVEEVLKDEGVLALFTSYPPETAENPSS